MAEETEPSQDKQSKLKLKLKKMGVLREDGDSPVENKQSFWRSKLPVIIVVLLAVGFWWWYSASQHTETSTVADNTTPPNMPAYPPGYGPQPPPPPMPPEGPDWQTMQQADNQVTGDTMPPGPGWRGPGNRYDDRYGPPPGWGQGFQPPPPPPPGYYGGPYYGPPPPYYPQPYNGYYGPPPGYWR